MNTGKITGFFLCLDCFITSGGYGWDVCGGCGSDKVIQVDEILAPHIALLKKKGYITKNCCSGHSYYPFGYIQFEKEYNLPPIAPPFRIEENTIRWNIYFQISRCDQEFMEELYDLSERLYAYIENLDRVKDGNENSTTWRRLDSLVVGLVRGYSWECSNCNTTIRCGAYPKNLGTRYCMGCGYKIEEFIEEETEVDIYLK